VYDRLEEVDDEFAVRVREKYLELAAAEPARFTVIDATLPVEQIAATVRDHVSVLLPTL